MGSHPPRPSKIFWWAPPPLLEVSSDSNAPFLFAEDLGGASEAYAAAAGTTLPLQSPGGTRAIAPSGGDKPAWLPQQPAGQAGAPPAVADGNPLIQAMVGVVDKAQKGTEALDNFNTS